MVVGALLVLAMPFLWASATQQAVDKRFIGVAIVLALVFITLAIQYRARLNAQKGNHFKERPSPAA